MKNETSFRSKVIKDLEAVGAYCVVIHGHAFQAVGLPDVQVYSPRWSGHIEFKFGGNSTSTAQKISMDKIIRGGVPALVMRWRLGVVTFESNRGVVYFEDQVWKDIGAGVDRGGYTLARLSEMRGRIFGGEYR